MQTVAEMPFVAGHAALDFVNTAEERGHPLCGEALHTPADLRLWGERYGLLSAAAGPADPAGAGTEADRAEFRRAIEAREVLYRLFLARAGHGRPSPADLGRLAALVPAAYRAATLTAPVGGPLAWHWDPAGLATIRHTAVIAAAGLLTADPAVPVKQCPGDHCGWFFLDATKRGNRRWCSMGECGQQAKNARRRIPAAG
jgi:predicted RNA-binding Zn ribbon-like protein